MAINTQPETETYADIERNSGYEELQSILASQGYSLDYKEVAAIGNEMLGFFEALGEENEQKDSYGDDT